MAKQPTKPMSVDEIRRSAAAQLKAKGISTIDQLIDYAVKNPPPRDGLCFIFKQCCFSFGGGENGASH